MEEACGITRWKCLIGSGYMFLLCRREIKDGVTYLGVTEIQVKVEVRFVSELQGESIACDGRRTNSGEHCHL